MVTMATSLDMNPATRRWTILPARVDAASHSHGVRLRIGCVELDPRSGELTSEDKTIVLQSQPLQLLLMLIEYDGEMVTRDEIRKRIWGDDVIVDFDHSINTLVRKLRRVLCDSAKAPIYIETLERRGYRLMVPIEWVEKRRTESAATNGPTFSWITLPAAVPQPFVAVDARSATWNSITII